MDNNKDNNFNFWNDHSLEFLEMAMKRDFQERLAQCDGYGKKQRECGDTIEIFLIIKQGRIETISYDIKGCLYSHACVNTLIKLVKGQLIDPAKKIDANDIIIYLKTLPKQETHCAVHVLSAFHLALEDHRKNKLNQK